MDYLTEVRRNLQAAADKKAAKRAEESRKQRGAKIAVICLLVGVGVIIALFGEPGINF
jgi:hypothetical protein